MHRTIQIAFFSLLVNMAFVAYHFILGLLWESWWLLTLGCYYLLLSILRFFVLRTRKITAVTARVTGLLLIGLSVTVAGTVILSLVKDRGQQFPEILMIAIAVYAFTKITIATINFIKAQHRKSRRLLILRNISLANAFVSIFALQRSMLVSFGQMSQSDILLFNALTGIAVWIIVLYLGIHLLRKK